MDSMTMGPRILQGAIFKIFPVEAAATSNLKNWILQLGGMCWNDATAVQNPVLATFAIPLIDLAWYSRNGTVEFTKEPEDEMKDFFKSNFIYDTYIAKKRKNLNKYRFGTSLFGNYDANLFIERNLTWDLLAAQSANVRATNPNANSNANSNANAHLDSDSENRERPNSSSSPNRSRNPSRSRDRNQSGERPHEQTSRTRSDSSSSSSSSSRASSPSPSRRTRRIRGSPSSRNLELVRDCCPEAFDRWRERQRSSRGLRSRKVIKRSAYFKDESRCLLNFICHYELHSGILGRLIWQHMEKLGVWERTWQSLKNHFLNQIYPNLVEMACHLDDLQKFKAGELERKQNKRKPCYEFPVYDPVRCTL